MRHVLRSEVGIRNVEAIARPIPERAEVGNIRRPEASTEIGYQLPGIGYVEYPADVTTHSPGADCCAIGEVNAYIGVADAGTDRMPIGRVPGQVGEQTGLADG